MSRLTIITHGWTLRKIFKNKGPQMAGKCYFLRLVFANKVSNKRAVLLIFKAGFTESVL